jgi:hypothetical protein
MNDFYTQNKIHGSTLSHNKICNSMNATNIIIYLPNCFFLEFYFLVKIRVLHVTTPATPPRCSLGPYKRRRAPLAITAPFSNPTRAPSRLPLPSRRAQAVAVLRLRHAASLPPLVLL